MPRWVRVGLIATTVAIAVVGVALVATRDDGDEPVAITVADDDTTTTTEEPTTSTTEERPTPPQPFTTTTQPATTSTSTTSTTTTTATTAAPTTTTSIDEPPRCAQVNALTADGLSAQVCQEGPSFADQPTTLHLVASDGNARVRDDCGSPVFAWGDEDTVVCAIGCEPSQVPNGPSSIDITRDHTYEAPGTYTVTVTVESNCGAAPYGERQTLELELEITGTN